MNCLSLSTCCAGICRWLDLDPRLHMSSVHTICGIAAEFWKSSPVSPAYGKWKDAVVRDFDDMVRLDLKYARGWSIWLDLKILIQTPLAVFSGDGAH